MEVTNRIALSIASIPWRLWFAPLDAAESPEKSVTIPAASIWRSRSLEIGVVFGATLKLAIPNLRPNLSER